MKENEICLILSSVTTKIQVLRAQKWVRHKCKGPVISISDTAIIKPKVKEQMFSYLEKASVIAPQLQDAAQAPWHCYICGKLCPKYVWSLLVYVFLSLCPVCDCCCSRHIAIQLIHWFPGRTWSTLDLFITTLRFISEKRSKAGVGETVCPRWQNVSSAAAGSNTFA